MIMDYSIWPDEPIEYNAALLRNVMLNVGRQCGKSYNEVALAFANIVRGFTVSGSRLTTVLQNLEEAFAVLDMPVESALTRKQHKQYNHGPRTGTTFDRQGRRRY